MIDGLLTPRNKLGEYARRQIAPPAAVLREHAERAEEDVLGTLAPKRLNALRDLMLDAYAGSRPTSADRA